MVPADYGGSGIGGTGAFQARRADPQWLPPCAECSPAACCCCYSTWAWLTSGAARQRAEGAKQEAQRILGRVAIPLLDVNGRYISGFRPEAYDRALGS
jgi:hypothetical protein